MATENTASAAASLDVPGHRAGVMSRLHSLFPTYPPTQDPSDTAQPTKSHMETPKFIKIRMLTWNMYDSLPKGDLEELLGSSRAADPAYIPLDAQTTIPDLPADDELYHLVVVACQECPTVSGIPRGLGAPEFKRKERGDRDKSKEKDRDDLPDRPHSRQQLVADSEKSKDAEEKESREHSRSTHRFNLHKELSQHRISRDDIPSSAGLSVHSDHTHHPSYGWSAMLEDWYVDGGKHCEHPLGPSKPPVLDVPIGDEHARVSEDITISPKAKSAGDLNAHVDVKASSKGPYELLVKERMMGLYLAVFINRDIKGLVRGTSKSSVTAGLIGGRVGNKGAIGVSINLNGKTFLFINAHLAAHGGKMQHRLANLTKIKTELAVDSFLSSDDPRLMQEDLTERFDHTFFCGDLNFRLDITRLHADWLISRKDYEQALAFDELRKVMARGDAFVGFQEGSINFPPTFKYDVARPIKRSKHSIKRSAKAIGSDPLLHEKILTEIEEQEREEHAALLRGDDMEDEEEGGEATSIASTAWTSNSRYTGDAEEDDREDEEYFPFDPDTVASTRANAGNNNVVHKVLNVPAVNKAKAKWMSILHSPGAKNRWSKLRPKLDVDHIQPPPSPIFMSATFPPTPDTPATPGVNLTLEEDEKLLKPTRNSGSGRISPTKPRRKSDEIEDAEDADKGVYDSSHKQRVPSWCDRILWKSTTELLPYEVVTEEEPPPMSPPRTRMGHIFHALRPGTRNRKDSYASTISVESTPISPTTSDTESSDTGHYINPSPRLLVNNARPSRLSRSQSSDSMNTHERLVPSRSATFAVGGESPPSSAPPVLPPKPHAPYAVYRPRRALPSAPVSTPLADVYNAETPPPIPSKDLTSPTSHRWLTNFLPFLSRDYSSQTNLPLELPLTRTVSPVPLPQRGEVVCLEYRTLDDKGMKRLEARSDHRPVIGSYAVYI